MGFKKRESKRNPDLKSQSAVLLKQPASQLTKEQKKILSARMAEIRKYAKDNNTVQNTIPYMTMFQDGICQVSENFYSATVQFYEANYSLAEFDEQNDIFSKYCDLFNSFDNTIHFQLTFENQNRSKEKLVESIQIPEQEDAFNEIRREYSQMLTDKLLSGSNGQSTRKFLTFGIESTSYGLTDFYAGGAIGWDTLAAQTVLRIKERYPHVRLHLVLPCSNAEQTAKWSEEQKAEFYRILSLADDVEYTSEHLDKDCMKRRNARLVELATDYCICYWNESRQRTGTGQTVRMAETKGLQIINFLRSGE